MMMHTAIKECSISWCHTMELHRCSFCSIRVIWEGSDCGPSRCEIIISENCAYGKIHGIAMLNVNYDETTFLYVQNRHLIATCCIVSAAVASIMPSIALSIYFCLNNNLKSAFSWKLVQPYDDQQRMHRVLFCENSPPPYVYVWFCEKSHFTFVINF